MNLNARPGRCRHILLSLGLHLALGTLVVGLAWVRPAAEEKVYQVALVQPPGRPAPPAASPAAAPTPPPEAEPVPSPPPMPEPEPEPVKQISPLKKPAAAPAPKPAAAPRPDGPAPSGDNPAPAAIGPSPSYNIGGLAAYDAALVDEPPAVTRRALPVYPPRARGRVAGRVEISLVVDADGNPREPRVLRAEPPGYGFEEAALEAARKTRFMPGKVRGRPVNTLVTLPFVFNIR